jgi:hypothetical protein
MKSGSTQLRPNLVLVFLSLLFYLPISIHASQFYSDYGAHIDIALALPATVTSVTHVLYHAVFLAIHQLLPSVALPLKAAVAILPFMVPVPLIAFSVLKKASSGKLPDLLLMALSLGLTIMAPVTIWTSSYMIGYFNPIVYHNPTMIAVRLFTIPLFLLAVRIFQLDSRRDWNHRVYQALLCAVLVLLASLAKPSYTFVLLPGCCLFAFWQVLRHRKVDLPLLALGICLPGVLMLGVLYLLAYYSHYDGSSIAIGFLTFMQRHTLSWRLPIQLILSLVFPIGLYIGYRKEAQQDSYLSLSWIMFGIGASMAYLLYEDGPRVADGNFVWSGYSAVFVLMFASLLFFCRAYATSNQRSGRSRRQVLGFTFTRREAIVLLLFLLHVVSGIAYYFRFLAR